MEAVAELEEQLRARPPGAPPVERIYFACGSGGTAAGLALGLHLSSAGGAVPPELVGLCVDDTPALFHAKIDGLLAELRASADGAPGGPPLDSRKLLTLLDCVGAGYAVSTADELRFIAAAARATGVVLDPVYSGKAARGMAADLEARPCAGAALFVHTGGALGLYAKLPQLGALELWGARGESELSSPSPDRSPHHDTWGGCVAGEEGV